ncbi:uncharacterized protein YecT (DUF1311 family) [Yoonia maricola]|uniref:Uncharacterized protein YecT (DUF1311 family) n=1 Tax=Yoonia maricola TaxID=420999 RepID=A0A2M8WMY0_9RHOB|nr:lysozyme inhibitor LprI family protein [Yoonia maricola]PJI92292.1 uncharacterized protein YecT (DUF1311 family) [Yoonia maricola]
MKIWMAILTCGALGAVPAQAQDLVFSDIHTEACLQEALGAGERHACIGASANQCMTNTPGGESTVGMGGCLERERSYWDGRLNDVYQQLLAQQGDDAAVTNNLRAMQRAWITYRDARCDYEYVQWEGGTGGGPALLACLMQTTGEQVLVLEQYLR